jgi:deoxyhypusine synthase
MFQILIRTVSLHERGENRVGNIVIHTESYMKFEDKISEILEKIYLNKKRISSSELLYEIGLNLNDENSFLYQAAKNNIPVYCPGIADSSFGFQFICLGINHSDFIVDTVKTWKEVTLRFVF